MNALILFIIYIPLTIAVGVMAASRNRLVIGYVLLCLVISPVIVLVILAVIGERNDMEEEFYRERSRTNELANRIQKLEKKETETKKCPLCDEKINQDAVFCQFCGGNVRESEEKENQRKRQEFEKNGIAVLLDDENFVKEANLMRRLYGKNAYVSYVNEKAKERGLGDINFTEADADSILI